MHVFCFTQIGDAPGKITSSPFGEHGHEACLKQHGELETLMPDCVLQESKAEEG
jgi:hypothetical protein